MNGPDAQRYTEDMIKGWKDPAPYPFVLAGVTPSLGTEHLIVPAGAGHLGVFSLASGLMVHSFNLPGVGNDDIAAMTTLRNPNPTGEVSSAFVPTKGAAGGVGASVRALLAVATSSYKGVRIYALDEGAAQVARVMDTRAEVARMIGPPDRKKKKKAGAVKEGVDGEGGWISSDDSGDESDTEDSSSSDSTSDSTSDSDSDSDLDSDSDTSSSSSDGDELTRRAMAMSLRDDSPRNRAP